MDKNVQVLTELVYDNMLNMWNALKSLINLKIDARFIIENIMCVALAYEKNGVIFEVPKSSGSQLSLTFHKRTPRSCYIKFNSGGSECYTIKFVPPMYGHKYSECKFEVAHSYS